MESIYADTLPAVSKDCLNLNIWAPDDAENAPVFVWIHGGSLMRGANSQSLYNGASYAERGLVFVSVNYRLGVRQWLEDTLPAFEMSDQKLVLRPPPRREATAGCSVEHQATLWRGRSMRRRVARAPRGVEFGLVPDGFAPRLLVPARDAREHVPQHALPARLIALPSE